MIDNEKGKSIISFPLMVIAALFLFNPNVAIVDPLPDFIGYILLCFALSRIANIHETLEGAFSAFKKMIFIDCGKFFVMLWVFGMTVPSERNSSILLWSFAFAVLDCIFLIPAYRKLFDGITQLGYLYENSSVFGKNRRISYTGAARVVTYVFVSVKAVFSFLPELADLTNTSYDETVSGTLNLYRYIGLMRGMAVIPMLTVGLVWLGLIIAYFHRICKDGDLQNALYEKYEKDVRPLVGLFIRRGFSTATLMAIIALCFTVDLRLEDVNVLPDFVVAIFFALAFIYIGRHNGQTKKSWIPSTVVYFITALSASVCEYIFFKKYYYGAIIKSDEARAFYVVFVILDVLKSSAFVWVLLQLYRELSKMIFLHTGFVLGRTQEGDAESKLVSEVHSELKSYVVHALIASAVYIVSDICYDVLAP